ncbi:MAG: phosphoribosyltransferase family protein [Halioglobus sp.]
MTPEYYLAHIDLKAMAKPDFSTMFIDPEVFKNLALDLSRPFLKDEIDKVACPESMGFIFGAAVARRLNKGLVPIRKAGKLPTIKSRVTRQSFLDYTKERNSFEMNKSLIQPGDRVLLVDDWAETGGQLKGLIKLIEKRGGVIAGISLLGFNRVKKTRALADNYKLRAIIEHTLEGERDLTKPLA